MRPIPILPFLVAFFAAPLLVTALTFWVAYIPLVALYLGGPVYVVLGLPVLWIYLRRYPPDYIPILLLALISVLSIFPLSALAVWWTGDTGIFDALPVLMLIGAIFAGAWSLTFTVLYRWLTARSRP